MVPGFGHRYIDHTCLNISDISVVQVCGSLIQMASAVISLHLSPNTHLITPTPFSHRYFSRESVIEIGLLQYS